MQLTKRRYKELENDFSRELGDLVAKLPYEDVRYINHYLSHTEIEMAFEILGISIMNNSIHLSLESKENLHKIGLALGLDKDSVFDIDFWEKFISEIKFNDDSH